MIRLSEHMLKDLERQFPAPIVTASTTALEAAAHAARQHVFKVLREGYATDAIAGLDAKTVGLVR